MDMVARVAAGADALGVDEILIVREPFRIAERALEWMPLSTSVKILEIPLEHTAVDTQSAIRAFIREGIDHVVSLGGDGTQRIIAKTCRDIHLIPLSTGTNNVYPLTVEPTIAGMVAALAVRGLLPKAELTRRSKIIHFCIGEQFEDLGLIDVIRMDNDFVGNFRPFNPANIREIILTRAEPDSIGMSPIGGLIDPVAEEEDAGLFIRVGGDKHLRVPVSPGHFRDVAIKEAVRVSLGEELTLSGPGIIAVDGDRLYKVTSDERVSAVIRRDGPYVYDVPKAMAYAAREGLCSH